MRNRRKKERRVAATTVQFPLFDGSDTLVRRDRRDLSDRRLQRSKLNWQQNQPKQETDRLTLLYRGQEFKVEAYALDEPFTLGRSSKCNLRVNNSYTSNYHAQIEHFEGEFILTDHSLNGTYVESAREGKYHVSGDKIYIYGEGVISLGTPKNYSEQDLIEYRCE